MEMNLSQGFSWTQSHLVNAIRRILVLGNDREGLYRSPLAKELIDSVLEQRSGGGLHSQR